MPEEKTESKLTAVADATKHQAWKWLGALIMTTKTNAEGEKHLAVSLTKLQKLVSIIMGVVLFVVMIILWVVKPEAVAETATVTDPIPNSMLYTLWGLLGLQGVNMAAGAYYGRGQKEEEGQ